MVLSDNTNKVVGISEIKIDFDKKILSIIKMKVNELYQGQEIKKLMTKKIIELNSFFDFKYFKATQ